MQNKRYIYKVQTILYWIVLCPCTCERGNINKFVIYRSGVFLYFVMQQQRTCWSGPTVPPISNVRFPATKESDFSEWLQFHTRYVDAAISKVTSNAIIRYGISARGW